MKKTILITGATDGIGFETAKMLVPLGHKVLLHGRNQSKLEKVIQYLSILDNAGPLQSYCADLSIIKEGENLARAVAKNNEHLDVLINNAGVFVTPKPITDNGLDVRFVVNTIAPYLLTQRLLPLMNSSGRVINLSSAAQSPVDPKALTGEIQLKEDFAVYAQSKLALTMWSRFLALSPENNSPAIIAINPGSMLGTKMVKDAFGSSGKDITIGAAILIKAALSEEFNNASGQYFDNDSGQFTDPHPDALDPGKCKHLVTVIEELLNATTAPHS